MSLVPQNSACEYCYMANLRLHLTFLRKAPALRPGCGSRQLLGGSLTSKGTYDWTPSKSHAAELCALMAPGL